MRAVRRTGRTLTRCVTGQDPYFKSQTGHQEDEKIFWSSCHQPFSVEKEREVLHSVLECMDGLAVQTSNCSPHLSPAHTTMGRDLTHFTSIKGFNSLSCIAENKCSLLKTIFLDGLACIIPVVFRKGETSQNR